MQQKLPLPDIREGTICRKSDSSEVVTQTDQFPSGAILLHWGPPLPERNAEETKEMTLKPALQPAH